jgi:hypothetical protein
VEDGVDHDALVEEARRAADCSGALAFTCAIAALAPAVPGARPAIDPTVTTSGAGRPPQVATTGRRPRRLPGVERRRCGRERWRPGPRRRRRHRAPPPLRPRNRGAYVDRRSRAIARCRRDGREDPKRSFRTDVNRPTARDQLRTGPEANRDSTPRPLWWDVQLRPGLRPFCLGATHRSEGPRKVKSCRQPTSARIESPKSGRRSTITASGLSTTSACTVPSRACGSPSSRTPTTAPATGWPALPPRRKRPSATRGRARVLARTTPRARVRRGEYAPMASTLPSGARCSATAGGDVWLGARRATPFPPRMRSMRSRRLHPRARTRQG